MSIHQPDLLDLLAQDTPGQAVVHAVRPNMWGACGWCICGCEGRKGDRFVLRQTSTAGVTCPACITAMTGQEASAA